jgi:glycosyltransferase involved in cell wall biosynthesis
MEAISFGIPVTGCDVCGLPEIVNEKTGILLEEHFDPKLVAQKIEVFLKEKSRDAQYRQGVKEFWRENFNAERNYAEFVEILKN